MNNYQPTIINRYPLFFLSVICLLSVAITLILVTPNYWLDDSFISFRYAKNLYENNGFVFNTNIPVEGYTNFLWTIFSYIGLSFNIEPINFTQFLSVVSQAATLWFTYRIGRTFNLSPQSALIAPLFLSLNAGFISYPMTGMETSFFTMLVTLAVLLLCKREQNSIKGIIKIGFTLSVITLVRFDGFVIATVILAYWIIIEHQVKKILPIIFIVLLPLIIYNLWRISYYPTILPNTFYAKVGFSLEQIKRGIIYVYNYFILGTSFLLFLSTMPLLLKPSDQKIRFLSWIVIGYLSYIIIVGGDWMSHYRFILPITPILYILFQQALVELFERYFNKNSNIIAFCIISALLILNIRPLYKAKDFNLFSAPWFYPLEGKTIGKYIDKNIPQDWLIAIEWAGILPYYTHQPILDTLGLNDRDVLAKSKSFLSVGRRASLDYIKNRNSNLVVPCLRTFPSIKKALESTKITYEFNGKKIRGSCRYWKYLDLAIKPYNYNICILEVEKDKYWPAVIKNSASAKILQCVNP